MAKEFLATVKRLLKEEGRDTLPGPAGHDTARVLVHRA